MGFAVISSDAGHTGAQNPFFGIDPQARLDYGYQAVAKLTPMAKAAIQTAYGKAPDRSYFGGCSNGGRHTMVAAARYADQYDGFLAGDPGFRLPLAAIANIGRAPGLHQLATDAGRPVDRLHAGRAGAGRRRRARQVRRARRLGRRPGPGHQGLPGGVRPRTATCRPAPARATAPACSAAQKTAIGSASPASPRSTGTKFYSSWPFDAGIGSGNCAFWNFTAPLVLDSGAIAFIWQVPPENPAGLQRPDLRR